MTHSISIFSFPTRVIFGAGALVELDTEIRRFEMRHPFLVTDSGVARAGHVERVKAAAGNVALAVFEGVSPNPTEANILDGLEHYRLENCDGIIALGGGSPLDAAKVIRLAVTHPLPLEQYDDQGDGSSRINNNLPPLIAIPTTSGTGSEVGRSAVIVLKATDRKTVIFSPHLIPNVALDDPELTIAMPPAITAGTGLDALTHNVEAYLATGYHPMCDAIALSGTRLAVQNLAAAVHRGRDLGARSNMMMASMMGAVAFQKGLGVVHSLAHPLSSIGGLHHGTTNGVLLPYVMEFNRPTCEERIRDLALTMDLDVAREPVSRAATAAIERVRELLREIGVPDRLSQLGIKRAMIPALSKKAVEDACHLSNPRPCTEADMVRLYELAF
ncbi:MAG TPA: iron-containing alcohol dehydrogenase [Terriglobia bacterium]|nr:iron-containing alcohol dehydrogenase [Terriglobia bacterium]